MQPRYDEDLNDLYRSLWEELNAANQRSLKHVGHGCTPARTRERLERQTSHILHIPYQDRPVVRVRGDRVTIARWGTLVDTASKKS